MSDQGDPTILITVKADRFSVAPGETLEIPVVIKNQSASPDQVRITVKGIPLAWVSTDQPVVLIQPGEERSINLIVQPPAPPGANAGRHAMRIILTSTFDQQCRAETELTLIVAGFEVPGRVGVLMNGLQYVVTPGEELAIPVVLTNQGLGTDTFHLDADGLPLNWGHIDPSHWRLEAGETVTGVLVIQPARNSASRAGRYPFTIHVKSVDAPEQNVAINCTLTVSAFTEIETQLYAPAPERNQPALVRLANLSNIPATVVVRWESPEGRLAFDPAEPQQINLELDGSDELAYTARPLKPYWVGGEKEHPFTVTVQAAGTEDQVFHPVLHQKALMPPWLAALGGILLLLCCLFAGWWLLQRGVATGSTATPTLTANLALTNTPMPTATQSRVDQSPLLVNRNWFLVSYNQANSKPGSQEPFSRFNPDGTLIGFTGCKNFNGSYRTETNRITINAINLSGGACPEASLQVQEDMVVAILRSARSFLVADTTLQLSGDAGFLNYSLTPPVRPQEIPPPQAVIQSPPQALVGEIVTFDGSQSSGRVPLVSWRWEFGDGQRASGRIVQHAIGGQGTFAVQLTVTDQRGGTNTTTRQILIAPRPTAVPPPTVVPSATPLPPPASPTEVPPTPPPTEVPQPEIVPPQAVVLAPTSGYIGEPVALDASSSTPGSSPIVSYTWSFGNGTGKPASPLAQTTAIYNSAGMYEITVVAADTNGMTNSATVIITINARLETDVWTLSFIDEEPLLPGTAITLQFLDGGVAGFAGCNDYSGRYTVADNGDGTFAISVDRLNIGRRACPPEIMTQENDFESIFQAVTTAMIQENMLILSGPDVQLVFYLITEP